MIKENLIFDIGMHIGQDTRHYLNKGFKVLAIEANPELVQQNKLKFKKEIDEGSLTILNIGISNKNETIPFYKNHRLSEWSSFVKEIGTRLNSSYEIIQVECTTTENLFKHYGVPYYLKIDIEGNDYLSLNAISEENMPSYVSCEATSIELLYTLYAKGYRKFKLINQADNFKPININKEKSKLFAVYLFIKCGILLRIQKYLPIKHIYSSSGPFGENTKGKWLTFEETEKLYHLFYRKGENEKALNDISWFDFHATII